MGHNRVKRIYADIVYYIFNIAYQHISMFFGCPCLYSILSLVE